MPQWPSLRSPVKPFPPSHSAACTCTTYVRAYVLILIQCSSRYGTYVHTPRLYLRKERPGILLPRGYTVALDAEPLRWSPGPVGGSVALQVQVVVVQYFMHTYVSLIRPLRVPGSRRHSAPARRDQSFAISGVPESLQCKFTRHQHEASDPEALRACTHDNMTREL